MWSLLTTFASILLVRRVHASISTVAESRFGLSFSPTTITASRFNTSGKFESTTFPASSEYQRYYQRVAGGLQTSPYTSDSSNITSIFHDAINPVTKSLSKQLRHKPEYAALFLPSLFDIETTTAAADAIFRDAPYATRAGSSRIATCYAYGFLEGENLGRSAHECDEYGPENFIIVFEYEKEYLYAWLLVVAFELGTYPVMEKQLGRDYGEGNREVVGEQVYRERVDGFVQDFIEQQVLPGRKREDIRAVIITGEASAANVAELGATTMRAVGTKEVKLMTDFKPSEVVAHGAAVWARMTQEHPEYFKVLTGNKVPDDEYWAEQKARESRCRTITSNCDDLQD